MLKLKKSIALFLAIAMIFAIAPEHVLATTASTNVSWAGAMNFNDANNYVTSVRSLTAPNMTEMKWAYPLNTSAISSGAYYAGQSVIVDGYLYATGGGKLHRVDIKSGVGTIINDNAGSTDKYYDYLCYADGMLLVSTQDSIAAYSLDGARLGAVSGTYGYYHPIQYHDGYAICNGFIYKVERENSVVSFTQIGSAAIGGDAFNWSSGAFVDGLFYVAAKTTVYAVDYKTNTVVDSYAFDANRTASNNVQGGLCYDADSGRLFWATYTYNTFIHSIAIAGGEFVENSYMSEDAGQKSVVTPVVYNGRVYLATQQGRICVHNASDLSKVYDDVTLGGGKVQGTPILSTADEQIRIYAQCTNGHLYMFTDKGECGQAVKLAETENYTKVSAASAYEQYAMDNDGNIYCYNESGYLFCFGKTACEKPTVTKDLSAKLVKYGIGAQTQALNIEATVFEGELSYQWQSSADGDNFADISGATENSYIPSSDTAGTTYYRCVITNTVGDFTASERSSSAYVLVKNLSNKTTLNAMAGKGNSATATSNIAVAAAGEGGVLYVENCAFDVKNIFLGVADEGSVEEFKVIYGASTAPKKYSVSNETYTERHYVNAYTKPIVAKVSVVAEDGISKEEHHIVVSEGGANKYITEAEIRSDSEYFSDDTIAFTEVGQSAELAVAAIETVGKGEVYSPKWEWTSSDTKVVSVDENGVVNCIGGGQAVVTVSYQGVSASVNIISSAPVHAVHSYVQGVCSVCTHKEPTQMTVRFTVIDRENNVAVSKDGATQLYKTALSVGDIDCDGTLTLNDAFMKVHVEYSENGAADFVTEDSSYGPFITKLWGEKTSDVAYMLNDAPAYSLLTALNEDDSIAAYFYRDTKNYSDIYTCIDGNNRIVAGVNTEFCLKGISSSGEVIAKGATVEVFDENGEKVSAATVGDDGEFAISIKNAGEYVLKAGGVASYTGQVWDGASGGYKECEFTSAPVVISQLNITVIPYAEKTVYVTIATKNGEFGVNKNGEDMWRIPVVATDNPNNPDGAVTISEVLVAAHELYHSEGVSAYGVESSIYYGEYITKLWGENNGGNCQYYFNDVEMTGTGTKIGTNSREWEDKLLDTVVESGDAFTIYSLQATDYKKADLYTYFNPVSEAATVGNEKLFTLKSVAGYGSNKVETSVVTVRDSKGNEVADLATEVGNDGVFKITFTQKGTYTVDVRTNGANYISPARCIVHVTGGGTVTPKSTVYISVKDPQGKTYLQKTAYSMKNGETAFSLLEKTGLKIVSTEEYQYSGVYVESIEGLGEMDDGSASGWMYSVNGEYPEYSSSLYILSEGDYVQWTYTRELGEDIGSGRGSSGSSFASKEETKDKNNTGEETEAGSYADVSLDAYYADAVRYVTGKNLFNGISESEFAPDADMTREMLVTVLWRLENKPVVNYLMSFDDVKPDGWYTEAVRWAASDKIILGEKENCFGIGKKITREQIAVMLMRYIGADAPENAAIEAFEDAGEISAYAVDAMKWAVEEGIINGAGNKLLPRDNATRAEVATMIMRFCEALGK